ncbi:hypothetical protein FS749_015895 [Ceratobasidium sp. UAMH 11750]|nr:hypothetical protein FS749_015895 [Ceratobasidium sp. UAMH 11750]
MRVSPRVLVSCAVLAAPTWGWGHKITATIAQIHLLPSAKQTICGILPSRFNCSLANVATWPDEVKKQPQWAWSAGLHFVNGVKDYPPQNCTFGRYRWTTDQNILNGIVNTTRGVESLQGDQRDISLRFLTHYLGDIHQPLHLTGRDIGGNRGLHFMWDDLLILYRIRNLSNYTTPLPTSPTPSLSPPTLVRNRQIESALTGSNYDPLVRWIVLEGIYSWWNGQLEDWTTCPQFELDGNTQKVFSRPPFEDPLDVPVCPYHWAEPAHQMVCDFIWRADLEGVKDPKNVTYSIELNTPEYAGRVRDEKMVEKQRALGGMRLAAVLNEVLGSEEEKAMYGVRPKLF